MTTFVGSPNSRYYVGVRGEELFFTKEDSVVWHKQISFEDFQVVAVGGNGNVYLRTPEGIFAYDVGGREIATPIDRWSRKSMSATSSQLGGVKVSADGRTLCVERASLQTRLSQKIFEFLSSNKVEANTIVHEIFLYNVTDDTARQFYSCPSSTKNPQKFMWDISIDFQWIVLAEPEKKSSQIRFSVAHVPSQTIYHEFAIPHIRINALHVSRDGTALVDVTQKGERGIVIVTLDSHKYNLTVPSIDYTVRHIGKDFVAIMTETTPFLLVKGFDDRLRAQADMRPLQALGIDYDVSFNERDAIDLMSLSKNAFKVVHTNVEFLETDARRWEQLSQEREAAAEAERNPAPPPPKVQRPQKLDMESRSQPSVEYPPSDPSTPARALPLAAEPTRPYVPGRTAETTPYEEPEPRLYADENYRYIDEDRTPAPAVREIPAPPVREIPAPPVREVPAPPVREIPAPPPTRQIPAPPPAAPRREPLASPRPTPATGDNGVTHPPAARPPRVIEVPGRKSAAPPPADSPPAAKKIDAPRAPAESSGRSRRATPAPASPAPPAAPRPAAAKAPSAPLETSKVAAAPARASAAKSAASGTLDETERRRIQRLLELLEERFTLGQVSESTYADLKAKYTARLGIG